jgi:predicted nucleotide-binding protein (sugar kinase/HSP70/actin superfamily)
MKRGMTFYGTKLNGGEDGKLMSRSEFRKAKKEAKYVGKVAKQQAKLEELRKPKDVKTVSEKAERVGRLASLVGEGVAAVGGIVETIKRRKRGE